MVGRNKKRSFSGGGRKIRARFFERLAVVPHTWLVPTSWLQDVAEHPFWLLRSRGRYQHPAGVWFAGTERFIV